MIPRFHVLAGVLLCLSTTAVLAVPPRFSDGSDGFAQSDTAAPALGPPLPAALPPSGKSSENKKSSAKGQAASAKPESKPAKAKPSKLASSTSSDVISLPGHSHSWLWRLFHKHGDAAADRITIKHPGRLVNTSKRHRPLTDVLQTADLHQIEPGYDARWHVQSSREMCRMKQQLPSYGYVEFRQGVAQPLEFTLYVDNPPAGSGVVEVSANPPIWRHYVKARKLGRLELDDSQRAVIASSAWSRRLMLELEDGMQPVLHYWDAADASDDVQVFVSAIRFQQSLALFDKCLLQLLHYNYKSVKHTVLHFNPDSSRFHKRNYAKMDELLGIIKTDKGIREIDLGVYTVRDEGLQRYNFRLAVRRAQAVRDYLLKHGIDEDKVFIKIHTKSRTKMDKLGYSEADVYVTLERNKPK